MSARASYTITIENFFEHNPKHKKGYTHFMVSKRLFNDQKIAELKPIEFQLYVYCLSICADMMSNQFQISAQMVPKYMRISEQSLSNHLERLKQLQLLTVEKNESLNNRKEKKRIEKNRKEDHLKIEAQKIEAVEKPKSEKLPALDRPKPPVFQAVVDAYFAEFEKRYGVKPTLTAKDFGLLKTLANGQGLERSQNLIGAYFSMTDKWFITKRHDVQTLLGNLNAVGIFINNRRQITSADIQAIERSAQMHNALTDIQAGGF